MPRPYRYSLVEHLPILDVLSFIVVLTDMLSRKFLLAFH